MYVNEARQLIDMYQDMTPREAAKKIPFENKLIRN